MQVIGTAGHVDHGKSTLVRKLTGIDPDRFAEEKRRGLTIDLGFAWLGLPSGREVGIVDVPGHERFVRNMLAGAGGITVCLFVVAANEGWMPQSAEHLAILDVLGVAHGVVALTKADTVDEETVALVAEEVEERLAATTLAGIPVVPCSAADGTGLQELVTALDEAVAAAPPAPDLGSPRLWVDRVFTIAGAGTVVTGTLARGSLKAGDEVEIAPEGRRARVRAIQSHKKELPEVGPGNRVALNLAGLERQGAARGDAVVRPGWRSTRRVDVRVRVLAQSVTGSSVPLTEKGAHLLYAGSAEAPVRLKLFGTSKVHPGEDAFAQLHLAAPLPLARGDRFVVRDAGRVLTLGGGEVLDPGAAEARRSDAARRDLLAELAAATEEEALAALVRATGGMDAAEASFRSGAREPGRGVVRLASWLVTGARHDELAEAVRGALRDHHADRPLERGMAREMIRPAAELPGDAFDALLDSVDGIVQEGALVRLADHSVALRPEQEAARSRVVDAIEAAGFAPPPAKDLAVDRALLRALAESGDLVAIGDFYLTRGQAETAAARVTAAIEESDGVTVAEIRDLLGTTRKYAVPLCEWLDATGVTRRRGDLRVLGPRASAKLRGPGGISEGG